GRCHEGMARSLHGARRVPARARTAESPRMTKKGSTIKVKPSVPPVHGSANEENASAFRGVGRVKGRMWSEFMARRGGWLSHSHAAEGGLAGRFWGGERPFPTFVIPAKA